MRTPDPTFEAERRRDGRNVAPAFGALSGEGALQRVRAPERGGDLERVVPEAVREDEAAEGRSYYGLPLLKQPVWKWFIPAYFFTGGLAGACAVLGAAAQAAGGRGTAGLVRRCRVAATAGAAASAVLLVADLGRPARFLYMLRVFRPTSPMNMGTWILSGFGGLAGVATVPAVLPRAPRALARAADLAGYGAGVLGLPLVGYTGVLVANTAVPVWQGTRNTLPILFAFSGAVSAGALFQLWPARHAGAEMARRFGRLAKGAELAVSFALDAEAAAHAPRVARPLHRGRLRGHAPGGARPRRGLARPRPVARPPDPPPSWRPPARHDRGGARPRRHAPAALRSGRRGTRLGPRPPRELRHAAARARRRRGS